MKRLVFLTTVLGTIAIIGLSAASPVDPVNKDRKGIALKGYDAVAYFQQGVPVKGSPDFRHEWNGATWHFATATARDTFKASPEKFAPQYGGYCSWAVSNNYTADADPEAWKIVNGRLYVNYNKSVQKKWEPEAAQRISDADRNWPGLHK
jgi:hypothetical protein